MMTMSLAPATLPAGQRVYAIGDVHGCATRLEALHAQIRDDLASRPVAEPTVVHLGDYIDRGEDSAGVLARLLRPFSAEPSPRVINLAGNHEAMMLAAFHSTAQGGRDDSVMHWLANGGADTLASWGLPPRSRPTEWRERIPAEHIRFLGGLSLLHQQGGYIFVHAGLRPGVPLGKQTRDDMLWIREPFLSFKGELPGAVVHGHTPEHNPTVRPNRIGVDTGAVMGGALTCAVLEADRVGFLRA
jgi:serine/threonine protein phosphatase 1